MMGVVAEAPERTTAPSPHEPYSRRRYRLDRARAWLFLAPYIVLVLTFVIAPLLMAITYSFTHFTGIGDPTWVGLDNYQRMFGLSGFSRIIFNNTVLLLGVALWVILPLFMAVVIHELPGAAAIRTVLFVPALISPVIVAGAFRIMLTPRGVVNTMLEGAGLGFLAQDWINDDRFLLFVVMFVVAWALTGGGIIVFTIGLSTLPVDQVEAAKIDGATWWQMFRFVYEPNLRPITQFWTMILTIVTLVALFPWLFALLTGGTAVGVTRMSASTLDYFIYLRGIRAGDFGVAFAASVLVIVYLIVALTLQFLFFRWRSPHARSS